jgi:hypothetical protein
MLKMQKSDSALHHHDQDKQRKAHLFGSDSAEADSGQRFSAAARSTSSMLDVFF